MWKRLETCNAPALAEMQWLTPAAMNLDWCGIAMLSTSAHAEEPGPQPAKPYDGVTLEPEGIDAIRGQLPQ